MKQTGKKMDKPIPIQQKPVFDYFQILAYVGEKYGFDHHDYAGRRNREIEWEKANGCSLYASPQNYGGKYYAWINGEKQEVSKEEYDKQLKIYYANSKRFREYNNELGELPDQDYTHQLNIFKEINNGSTTYWPITKILSSVDEPTWVKEITQKVFDEFKEYLDENGELYIIIEW